jgi:hypothetical protein
MIKNKERIVPTRKKTKKEIALLWKRFKNENPSGTKADFARTFDPKGRVSARSLAK